MKNVNVLKFLSRILSLLIVVSFISCGDDDDDDDNDDDMTDPLVGTYVFSAAEFQESTKVRVLIDQTDPTAGLIVNTFNVGDDATLFVGAAIVGNAPCDDTANAAIDIRDDGSSFYICIGETGEAQQGTWEVNADRTQFTLTLTEGFATPVDVIIENFTLAGGKLTGLATIPLPFDVSIEIGEPLTEASVEALTEAEIQVTVGQPNLQTAEMDIEFTVVSQ